MHSSLNKFSKEKTRNEINPEKMINNLNFMHIYLYVFKLYNKDEKVYVDVFHSTFQL